MFVIDRYLPDNIPGGFFGYLKAHLARTSTINNVDINLCKIPLPLMRATQTKKLLKMINNYPQQEKNFPINKQKMTALEAYEKDFEMVGEKRINKRLEKKRLTIAAHNLQFLLSQSPAQLKEKMHEFTFAGFIKRFTPEQLNAQQTISGIAASIQNLNVYFFDKNTRTAIDSYRDQLEAQLITLSDPKTNIQLKKAYQTLGLITRAELIEQALSKKRAEIERLTPPQLSIEDGHRFFGKTNTITSLYPSAQDQHVYLKHSN